MCITNNNISCILYILYICIRITSISGSVTFPNNNLAHRTTASCCNTLLLPIPVNTSQIKSITTHVKDNFESNSSVSSISYKIL